ncbi:MAG TPA: hypothetical protein VHF22_02905 [Planctomycetota bacterium]|nr:hypothetical protein [Planctomycetota bacterium]
MKHADATRAKIFPGATAAVFAAALGLGLVAVAPRPARAEDGAAAVHELSPSAEAAISRGLAWLATQQDRITGSFGGSFKVASTSLAGLAFLASGDQYDRGRYGVAIHEAVRYLLSDSVRRSPAGRPDLAFFRADDTQAQGRMHSHGMAMLFLAECFGHTSVDDQIRAALRGAVLASLEAQTERGGWGYSFRFDDDWNGPGGGDDEASVTVTQVQALRAARNVGIYVPADAIGAALHYLKVSMNTSDGACRYSLTMGDEAERKRRSFELTAAAVSTLNASGVYLGGGGPAATELTRGLAYLRASMKKWPNPTAAATDFYYYGNFYAAQAMFQAEPADWEAWWPRAYPALLDKQRDRGHWPNERNFGEVYTTASALVILQLPRRYLPIFQK